ncbi:MAG TPA: hypothetical protein VGU23_06795 [Acidobacteriaceae bacterium]|nr:hypothetical protein [Acidobacteriaceae bacterium]
MTKFGRPISGRHHWCIRDRCNSQIRDRIQNHALRDISSKHYDRWHYMREKREAMKTWDGFVRELLNKDVGDEQLELNELHAPPKI